ncbi:pyruvate dehydrogenase (acetyl-transferring), homodimeric type [Candidatus Haliotispira prima]|uniref:Pyruvate dehydrogenase E1 component n=1 Tax=Candidatus Haliotispira prima TaxID=3034016 RepID=A0ABY8MMJ7_9SPIO|nr:pyruvate dehydrogenase (acetyl-transferring), homodimeric type [Candidatus Haliotispira prima]
MFQDLDPEETREWLEAFAAVIKNEGEEKAEFLIDILQRHLGGTSHQLSTPYINTIPAERGAKMPENSAIARNVAAYVRWNAMAMVAKANKKIDGIGGHIASFSSSGTIYGVGFDYFFRGPNAENGADLIFYQGHISPGIYARAYVEGRLSDKQLENFRQETGGEGLSSYPHPRLMPNFWQFPTVSMGLGPIMAIYQARFMKYMENRGFLKIGERKVWAFLGDGETDEPETLGAIGIAARENLDNLIFVLNCNLQRLDGPVRSAGKIVQEMEGHFRGAGWNVIKVLWSTEWDELFAKDGGPDLMKHLEAIVDGDFQRINANYKDGLYIREHLFNTPELRKLIEGWSDEKLSKLSRGGHDPRKVYAAMHEAVNHKNRPTIILVQTVKGHGMGEAGEAANDTHSQKKMNKESLLAFRNRFNVPLKDEELEALPFIKPEPDSPEARFIEETRSALGGSIPVRQFRQNPLEVPELSDFQAVLDGSGDREISTTMGFVRILNILLSKKTIADRIVPIVPDEARTFGMEGLFKKLGIYNPKGQVYTPVDKGSLMWYREDTKGQLLQEGINEAGGFSSWLAAGTSYANHDIPMIPFFAYYSMFGFQRIGDLAWAAGDLLAKGFLIGATAGRTTLNGEGLQHQDGHHLLTAATLPSCLAYDPSFVYEMAVVIQDGLKRMYKDGEAVFYYITAMNENFVQPAMPEGVEEGIRRGIYRFRASDVKKPKAKVHLLGSGSIFIEVREAARILEEDYGVAADIWSVPGIVQLYRDGMDCTREDTLGSPGKRVPYVQQVMAEVDAGNEEPAIISTDYVKAYGNLLAPYLKRPLFTLGTDGYGRSDSRDALREHFEVNRKYIVISALRALVEQERLDATVLRDARKKLGINKAKKNPRLA